MKRIQIDLANIASRPSASAGLSYTAVYADQVDLLRARAEILTGKDKALMQMYLENGSTFSQMARLAGVNEATIARRIHKLSHRLLDSEYITCLRHREHFSPLEQAIARDYFIEGLSQKAIALKRNTTVYRIRKGLNKIQEFVGALGRKH